MDAGVGAGVIPRERFRAAAFRVGGGLLGLAASSGWRAVAGALLGTWMGGRARAAVEERREAAARADAVAALPQAIERLSVCLLSGMSIEGGLRTIAPSTSGRLGDALTAGVRALDLGMERSAAYDVIARRAGAPEVFALTRAARRAERFGTSITETLLASATDLRARARAHAEADARTTPVKLIFPLVLCFLPAFVLLTVAPIALSAFRTLQGV